MESVTLGILIDILKNFGVPGLILVLWWADSRIIRRKEDKHEEAMNKVLTLYKSDMDETRQMYRNNVELVKNYERVTMDLKEVIIMNATNNQKLADQIGFLREITKG